MGSGGLLFAPDGILLHTLGNYYGRNAPKTNVSEARALKDYIIARRRIDLGNVAVLVIHRDSKLIILFLMCKVWPGCTKLVAVVNAVQSAVCA